MSESRTEIAQYVRANPGSHFSAIVDALDQATGQVQHHVSRLVRNGDIERATVIGQTHYYPTGYDDWEKTTLALLRRETAREILASLLAEDPQRPARLAADLGLARSTIEYHLERLGESDIVTKHRDDGHVVVSLERPHETARLLAEVDPGYADRFLDRFVALVDTLLEDAAGRE
jgi:predicted transcriptional regulator